MTMMCQYCDEEITPRDPISVATLNGDFMHWECGLRIGIGGLNHLQGRCSCCGGNLPSDPEGLTVRQAARMAAQVWLARNPEKAN
jgi:hypothetical protein